MKTIKNTIGQRLICGLAIIFALCGTWAHLRANEASTWIEARLHPKQGIYSFSISGPKLKSLIEPLLFNKEKLAENELVKISFKEGITEIHHDVTEKSVRGVVLDSDKERSELLFVKGWKVRIKFVKGTEAYIRSREEVTLIKVNESTEEEKGKKEEYKLPLSKIFTVEIHAGEIEAAFLLPSNSSPQNNNPIKLEQKRAPAGSLIEYQLREDAVRGGNSKIAVLFLYEKGSETKIEVAPIDVESKKNVKGLWGTVVLPKPEDFWGKWWRLSKPVKSVALVTNEDGTFAVKIDDISVTKKLLGFIGGVLVVFLFLVIVRLVKRVPFSHKWDKDRYVKWGDLKSHEKFFRFPLHFAVTPLGRYSISLAQILFWTFIVAFAMVYVAIIRGEFLTITGQILTLLGISGTTAVASKVAAVARLREIPAEYMKCITKDRLPSIRDLFSIGDVPNIFKFQIFAFTLISGFYVVYELIRFGNFPILGENLLTLMGISGGVYIANELATENVWTKLQELIKKHDKKEKELVELQGLDSKHKELENQLVTLRQALAKRTPPPPPDDPDKKREHELLDAIADIKKELVPPIEEVDKKKKALKNEIRELLEKIYTESAKSQGQ